VTEADVVAIVSALAWIPGVYMIVDAVRKRRSLKARENATEERVVVRSAIELLAPYKQRVTELEQQLASTSAKASALSLQLSAATRRANELSEQLTDAQAELTFLRVQVKSMTSQIKDERGGAP
jgi:chromosome segregation ATPase